MHVAHVETGSLAVQAARSQGGQPPFMRELRERIGLVHDLRELAAAEEILDRRRDRLRIDERARRHVLLIANRHALLHRAAQLEEAFAELVGRQLVDGAHAAVAEVVDVVDVALAGPQLDDVADGVKVIEAPKRHLRFRDVLLELAIDAETADLAEAITVGVLELLLEQLLRLFELRRVARTKALVDLEQRFLVRVGRILIATI